MFNFTNAQTLPEVEPDCCDEHDLNKSADPTDLYLKEVSVASLLSKDEEIYYAKLVQQGDIAAKNKMIESNLRLVIKIARRYLRSGMHILDLIEEGNLGLIRAVEKFDAERGFRFSTYGTWWIQQTIERAIMSQNRTIKLPVHMAKKLNACLRTSRELSKTLDHEPTTLDIAKKMDQDFTDIANIMSLNEKIVSMDSPVSLDFNKPFLDTVGSTDNDPAIDLYADNLKHNVHLWLAELTSNQRKVVERRFGLNQIEAKTLEQTSEDIGLTRERVRQLQVEALKQLKEIITKRGNDFNTLVT